MARAEDLLAAHVAARPGAVAVSDDAWGAQSFAELDAAVARQATRMRDAVQPGDRVMIVSENSVATVVLMFAAWQLGATVVPINARQSAREVDRVIAHADPRLVFFTAHLSEEAGAHAARLGASREDLPSCERQPDATGDGDIAVILYTTGTTGDPKGVMLSHDNLCFGARTSATLRNLVPDDVIMGVLPLTHVFGLSSVLLASIHIGAAIRLLPRFEPGAVLATLRDGVTVFSGVPQMHALLMAHAARQGAAALGAETLRYISSGAAPLDPAWKRDAEAFYGVAVQNGYGMTESTAGIAATSHAIGNPDMSVGPPLPGVAVRIDETVTGGGDGLGEVLTRGPHVMPGYYRATQATRAVLDDDGWLHTGDLGRFDVAGHLHILGRSKELIIRGGFNIYPPEVEAVLTDHPEVVQSAVIGRPLGGDEEVLAFVQVRDGSPVTAADLDAFLMPRLAGYKRPARYVIAASLPAAPTGKILKHKLLETFADALA